MTITDGVTLECGDMREVLARLASEGAQFDGCVTDPPYHLVSIVQRFGSPGAAPARAGVFARSAGGFMGKQWDGTQDGALVAFDPATWRRVYDVLKPGAHLLAFGAPRNFGRMQVAIEDAGFEIRDCITSLMRADELCGAFLDSLNDEQASAFVRLMGEQQFGGYLQWIFGSGFPKSHNVARFIDKQLGVEGTLGDVGAGKHEAWQRPSTTDAEALEGFARQYLPASDAGRKWDGWGTALKPCHEPIIIARKPLDDGLSIAENVLRYGTGALNIDGCRVATDDVQHDKGRWPGNVVHDGSDEVVSAFPASVTDADSVARFFYSGKADKDERLGSKHPTVKPVALMQWLIRMVIPPGGTVLDCFAGSGTTGEAAIREGRKAVLIEREPDYQNDIRRRMALAMAGPVTRAAASARPRSAAAQSGERSLFDDDATGET